ncbi:MAG: hypothetical protein OEM77_07955 [Nitrosopumilus sp.]|nr:hypothetical protein [Nitrosopumilus sp.]MDH3736391.1 hypothetical protein [Nitrosopumilus sp.]MDH3823128.1 hypothetical protein [Nitrosopumilus sp.]MDH3833422.1 hypothetical protein [Nitrosopumilus sp.]
MQFQRIPKRYPKKDKVKRDLIGAYESFNAVQKNATFAQLCDRWILLKKQSILYEQYLIDQIEDVYKEYVKLGPTKFFS